jgi:hypothetical protein
MGPRRIDAVADEQVAVLLPSKRFAVTHQVQVHKTAAEHAYAHCLHLRPQPAPLLVCDDANNFIYLFYIFASSNTATTGSGAADNKAAPKVNALTMRSRSKGKCSLQWLWRTTMHRSAVRSSCPAVLSRVGVDPHTVVQGVWPALQRVPPVEHSHESRTC